MKIGFGVICRDPTAEFLDLLQEGEDLGYDSAWIPDEGFLYDPFPLLAVAGMRTKRLQLGVGVTNPYTRHPVQIARTMGTIRDLVGRPVILGIGAGSRDNLLRPMGLRQESPAARCQEMIELTRRLLQGERVTSQEGRCHLEGVALGFRTPQEVPIYLAARGPRMLQTAGEWADGIIIGDLISPGGLRYALREVASGAQKAGRDLGNLNKVLWVACYVTNGDYQRRLETLKPWVAHHLVGSPPVVQRALGMGEDRIDRIRRDYAEGGIDAVSSLVTEDDIDDLAIVGPPDKCLQQIERIEASGVDQLVLLVYPEEVQACRTVIVRFAREVLSQLG